MFTNNSLKFLSILTLIILTSKTNAGSNSKPDNELTITPGNIKRIQLTGSNKKIEFKDPVRINEIDCNYINLTETIKDDKIDLILYAISSNKKIKISSRTLSCKKEIDYSLPMQFSIDLSS